jgi:sugar phosphate isomerase/epimerase
MQSRRDFARLLFSGLAAAAVAPIAASAAAARLGSQYGGVDVGVCLYNFRDIARIPDQDAYIDSLIDACVRAGVGLVEVNAVYLEPRNDLPASGIHRIQDFVQRPNAPGAPMPRWMSLTQAELQAQREALRSWRLSTPLSYYSDIGARFRAAGLTPYSFVTTFSHDMTDAEIDVTFRQAGALGVKVFSTNQTKVEMGPRLVAFAERYGFDIGFHNHTQRYNTNEVASVESFEKLFALSPRFKANLDVGHYTAASLDALEFVKRHPTRITHLHMKDRKRDEGPNMPWGQGDAPLREILLFIKENRLPIGCFVEYEYRGDGSGIEETRECLDFMRGILA